MWAQMEPHDRAVMHFECGRLVIFNGFTMFFVLEWLPWFPHPFFVFSFLFFPSFLLCFFKSTSMQIKSRNFCPIRILLFLPSVEQANLPAGQSNLDRPHKEDNQCSVKRRTLRECWSEMGWDTLSNTSFPVLPLKAILTWQSSNTTGTLIAPYF